MQVERLIMGQYETNCYVLHSGAGSSSCMVIDPGLESSGLIDFLGKKGLRPIKAALTHGHADHITGLGLLREHYPQIQVYIHKFDGPMLTGEKDNLSEMTGRGFKTKPAEVLLSEGDSITMESDSDEIILEVIHTPGHTPGGACFYCRALNVLFSGDSLFAGSVGRTDFPGGDTAQLISNVKSKLLTLPDETKVYPGHGPVTSIVSEKWSNPFLL